jgi:hypothetical protein
MPFTLLCLALYACLPLVGLLLMRMIGRGLRRWFSPAERIAVIVTFELLVITALVMLAIHGDSVPLFIGIPLFLLPLIIGSGVQLICHLRRDSIETSIRESRMRPR